MLGKRPTFEELDAFFSKDQFAVKTAGCSIVEGWSGHGVAEMPIRSTHMNAQGHVMGGAIFTLADFALAIASNTGGGPCVNVSTNIDYLSASKGTKLIAQADRTKEGRRLSFYDVTITDDEGKLIAKASVVCCNV